jgi:hypothetical protein
VRLRKTQRLGDLRLRPLEEETLEHDASLAVVECTRGTRDERAVQAELLERRRPVRGILVAELRGVRWTRQRPRGPDQRAAVAKVTQQLAFDAADEVRGKLDRPRRVAPVDCADERQRGHLDEILVPLARVAESARERPREGQVALDQDATVRTQPSAVRLEPPPLRRHEIHRRSLGTNFKIFSKNILG